MNWVRAAAVVFGLVVVASCTTTSTVTLPSGTQSGEPTGAVTVAPITTAPSASPTEEATPVAEPTPTVVSQSEPTPVALAVDPTASAISYWALSEYFDEPPSLRYAIASAATWEELYDLEARKVVGEVPFGAPPGRGITRIWVPGSGGPAGPGPTSIWPVECLGTGPDVDGDAILDDCDPFNNDGPLADFDADGVANRNDNCPATANPDQNHLGDPVRGSACSDRNGTHGFDRIIFPTVTVQDVNERRIASGFQPIVWPPMIGELPPAVAQWCDFLDESGAELWLDPDAIEAALRAVPAEYGFDEDDIDLLVRTSRQLGEINEAFAELAEDDQAGAEALEAEYEFLAAPSAPLFTVLQFSDQSCP